MVSLSVRLRVSVDSLYDARLTGELRIMFAHEDIYSGYMDKFFAAHHHPAISWIHDLGRGRFRTVSQTLLSESQGASDLQIQHVCSYFSAGLESNLMPPWW